MTLLLTSFSRKLLGVLDQAGIVKEDTLREEKKPLL